MKFSDKANIYIAGTGQLKVEKNTSLSIRQMGAEAIRLALADAGIEKVDAIYLGNMLSGVLSNQQQLGPLIATASDWETEGGKGETFVTLNSRLMKMYVEKHRISPDSFGMFGVNAHCNANKNPHALFHKEITLEDYLHSKFIADPVRIYDASPVCDGAAAIVLSRFALGQKCERPEVKITGSGSSTEFVGISSRSNPLAAEGIRRSGEKAYAMAGIGPKQVDFFEVHDAYSIISTLSLEAMGFAEAGKGWKLAANGDILPDGKIPVSTFGGLKARGHAVGASGVYQAVEAYLQLTDRAGANQIKKEARIGMIQSIGGTASTAITHILERA